MRTIGKITVILALVLVVGAPATAWILDAWFGQEVLIITPYDPEQVALNRQIWMEGDPVANIYGVPTEAPVRVLLPDPARTIRPAEASNGPILLAVDKQAGENPLQVRSLWFIAWRVSIGAAIAGLLGSLVLFWTRSR